MSFYTRIVLSTVVVVAVVAVLVWRGPQVRDVELAAWAPQGETVGAATPIRISFSRTVDRRSAEQNFAIEPTVPGRFFWQEQTLTFEPLQPLAADTAYQVTIQAGLRDERGNPSSEPLTWNFRTRPLRLLVLRNGPGGGSELWLTSLDGGEVQRLVDAPDGIASVAVSPNGAQAIYVAQQGQQRTALLSLNLDSGVTTPLVDLTDASLSEPAWSPTGEFIAFERRALVDGVLGVPRVWLAQPDGTLLGPLLNSDGSDINFAPVWSPDGNRVALITGTTQDIQIYDVFTSTLTTLAARTGEPVAWLPSGAALVYSQAADEGNATRPRVSRFNLDSNTITNLTDTAGTELGPSIAPDGTSVAFSRRAAEDTGSTIWLAANDGSTSRQLSSTEQYRDTQPAWSPDGRFVAFVRDTLDGASSAAWLVDVASGDEQQVIDDVVQVMWVP